MDERSSPEGRGRDEPVRYNVADARRQFSDLVARAEAGEEITISRGNRPVARPLGAAAAHRPPYSRAAQALADDEERARLDDTLLEPMSEEDLAIAEGALTDEHGISIEPGAGSAPKTRAP